MTHAGKMVTQAVMPETRADEAMSLAATRATQADSTIAHAAFHMTFAAHHASKNSCRANRSIMSGTPYAFAPFPSDRRSGEAPVHSLLIIATRSRPPLAEG